MNAMNSKQVVDIKEIRDGLDVKFSVSLTEPQDCERAWNAGIPFINIFFIMRIFWLGLPVKCYYIQI